MDETKMREVSGPLEKANTPNSSLGRFQATHRNWEDDFSIAGQVSNVAVQGHPLLNGPRLADGQGHAQNGVRAEFSCNGTVQLGISPSRPSSCRPSGLTPHRSAPQTVSGSFPLLTASTPRVRPRNATALDGDSLLSPPKKKPFLWSVEL